MQRFSKDRQMIFTDGGMDLAEARKNERREEEEVWIPTVGKEKKKRAGGVVLC